MSYVELYSNEVIEAASLGKTINDFNPTMGDYIKIEIYKNVPTVLATLYSNRLLLKFPEADGYFLGNYHYHPENSEMGFCTFDRHYDNSISNLQPISISNINDPSNSEVRFKKQIEIFKDDNDRIYIKPNEIIKLLGLTSKGQYRLRIHFLRDIKSILGLFLKLNKNNLIENGNFFAGLEATQTGDIDDSSGKNNFKQIGNPGFSPFVLEQSGLPSNEYVMKITGIESNSLYVFSAWIAISNGYSGGVHLGSFSNASSLNSIEGFFTVDNTDVRGTVIYNNEDKRILKHKNIGGMHWIKVYYFVGTNGNADLGSFLIHLGKSDNNISPPNLNPLATRYFTDLRLEKVGSFEGEVIDNYLNKLKLDNLAEEYNQYYYDLEPKIIYSNGDDSVEYTSTDNIEDDLSDSTVETQNLLTQITIEDILKGNFPDFEVEETTDFNSVAGPTSAPTNPNMGGGM